MLESITKETKSIFYLYRDRVNIALCRYPKIHSSLSPYLYGYKDSRIVSNRTDLVIEGFPGCANSFAVKAFKIAQKKEYQIAHHRHHPAQIISAVYRGLPTILLIRQPNDCVLSYVASSNAHILENKIDESIVTRLLRRNLKAYIKFYSTVYKYRDVYVIASFDRVTQDFGEILDSVNRKYNTDYDIFIHDDNNVKACFTELHSNFSNVFGNNSLEISVRKPSSKRKELKQKLKPYMLSPSLSSLRQEAQEIYQSYRY